MRARSCAIYYLPSECRKAVTAQTIGARVLVLHLAIVSRRHVLFGEAHLQGKVKVGESLQFVFFTSRFDGGVVELSGNQILLSVIFHGPRRGQESWAASRIVSTHRLTE